MPCSPHRRAKCFVTQIMIGVDFLPDWSRKQCFTFLLKTICRSLLNIRKAKGIRWCISKAKSNKINTTEYFRACIHSHFFFAILTLYKAVAHKYFQTIARLSKQNTYASISFLSTANRRLLYKKKYHTTIKHALSTF